MAKGYSQLLSNFKPPFSENFVDISYPNLLKWAIVIVLREGIARKHREREQKNGNIIMKKDNNV